MTEKRSPAIRKRTPKEELAKLHPIERGLLRLFESLASLNLALFLMTWLLIECVIGTFVESQVNTQAASYFVYGTVRFSILLAMLGLTILCAALIRFPWKRYQTGFVVTHLGMLVILTGAMMKKMKSIDALMSVGKDEIESTYFDPSRERITIETVSSTSGRTERDSVPVDFGPFTWGHKILHKIPWRANGGETIRMKSGQELFVKRYFANCDPTPAYVPTENGPPAVEIQVAHPQRGELNEWVAADPETLFGSQKLIAGSVVLWQVKTAAELDHFLKAVPKKNSSSGLLGTLGYSHGGKHHMFSVHELQKVAVTVPGTKSTLRVIEYLPNAKFRPGGKWVNEGDVPENPLLRIELDDDGAKTEYWALGAHPELSRLLIEKFGREHLFTYFPDDQPAIIHLAITPEGTLGYRAFGREGLIAAEIVKVDEEYPCWNGFLFSPLSIVPKGRKDYALIPKPLKKAKPGVHGVALEFEVDGTKVTTSLPRGAETRQVVGNKMIRVGYDVEHSTLPFKVRLDSFEEPKNPGTQQAAMYTSNVTLFDDAKKLEKKQVITMNAPLRYASEGVNYTLYQSGIDWSTGSPISTYTVAYDPGLPVIYTGAVILCTGIFLMFYMGGYFRTPRNVMVASDSRVRSHFEFWRADDVGNVELSPGRIEFLGKKSTRAFPKVVSVSLVRQAIPWLAILVDSVPLMVLSYFGREYFFSGEDVGASILLMLVTSVFVWTNLPPQWVKVEFRNEDGELATTYLMHGGLGRHFGKTRQLDETINEAVLKAGRR